MECLFQFPIDKKYVVSNVEITIGEKVIHTKILEKEEAKQRYEDQTASGNWSILAYYDEEVADILWVNIGTVAF